MTSDLPVNRIKLTHQLHLYVSSSVTSEENVGQHVGQHVGQPGTLQRGTVAPEPSFPWQQRVDFKMSFMISEINEKQRSKQT